MKRVTICFGFLVDGGICGRPAFRGTDGARLRRTGFERRTPRRPRPQFASKDRTDATSAPSHQRASSRRGGIGRGEIDLAVEIFWGSRTRNRILARGKRDRPDDDELLLEFRDDGRVQRHYPVLRDPEVEPDEQLLGRLLEPAQERERFRGAGRGEQVLEHAHRRQQHDLRGAPVHVLRLLQLRLVRRPEPRLLRVSQQLQPRGTRREVRLDAVPELWGLPRDQFAQVQDLQHFACHETREAVTDPDGNAWYDRHGNEADDKCAWSPAPFIDGGFGYQYEWSNANGGCVKTR